MTLTDIRQRFLQFYQSRGHAVIPSAPLVPENDPTTLFNSSGMQPLVPYLLGQPHPLGKRLVNSQKAIRLQDIDEVGDNRHTTFFEMLGNWSLGDYFKKEQLPWIWEFLTKELGLPKERLYVSVLKGDEESVNIWKKLGIPKEKIFSYGVDKNWWSRAGEPEKMPPGEPGGPDSEVFFEFTRVTHDPKFGSVCHPNCDCGRFLEIANSVFMQYVKKEDGTLAELPNKNVDFGGGLERMVAAANDDPDIFHTDVFFGARSVLSEKVKDVDGRSVRIILDHLRAAVFLADEGVVPSNKERGYVLRRLIRRASAHAKIANIDLQTCLAAMLEAYENVYRGVYPSLGANSTRNHTVLSDELIRFEQTLERGMRMIGKVSPFDLFQSYGFPPEIIEELFAAKGVPFDKEEFDGTYKKHQEQSRTASKGMFVGGLADQSEATTKLHTAHHLLLAALQKLVDPAIRQRGSNITAERLRMDVNFGRKITPEEMQKVEALVNEKILENLPVTRVEMNRIEAEKLGAQMEFGHTYPDRVSVYFVGPQESFFSAEFCGGPHVSFTGTLGHFTIVKEEALGSGIRRIYAELQ